MTAQQVEVAPVDSGAIERKDRGNRLRWRRRASRPSFLVHVVILALCLLWAIPLIDGLVTALRPIGDVVRTGWWGVFETRRLTFDNFREALWQARMGDAFINSVVVTLPANMILVSLSAIVAYAFTRMKIIGRTGALAGIVALMMIPPQLTLVPIFKLFNWLNLTGEIPAVWIFQGGYTMPLGIFILVAFFQSLPSEVMEAAEVDGATPVQAFTRVALPLARPGLLSVFILHFLFSWNDLLIPLLLLRPDAAPLTVRIASLLQTTSTDPLTVVAAAAALSVTLPIILFYALQKYFVRGLAAGATKG